ncbi:MAG: TldD/PmbA family protein [Pseudomonadota bacterium]
MTSSEIDPLDLAPAQRLASDALSAAQKAGADAADAYVSGVRGLSVSVREGAVEEAEHTEAIDLVLRVFVGGRSALVNVGASSPLKDAAERAVAMAKVAPPDESQGIAPKAELAKEIATDLDLFDGTTPTADALIERAHAIEEAMRHVPGVTKSGGASVAAYQSTRTTATTEGFSAGYQTSFHRHYAVAIAGGGTKMERDSWGSARRHLGDLAPEAEVGRIAGERTVRRMGSEPIPTQTATVIFEPRSAVQFISHLLSAINGASVARGATFLAEKKGQAVYPKGITVRDNPLKRRGEASRPFDAEGLAGTPLDLVADGVLQDFILDLQSARKLGLTSNGRAARGSGAPSPSATNIEILGGQGTIDDLIADRGPALLVTDLIGMGANVVNGNYSRGAAGFWYDGGELVHPVSEVTIAGNLADMFQNAIFADDAPGDYAINAPSIAIEGMTIGGR